MRGNIGILRSQLLADEEGGGGNMHVFNENTLLRSQMKI